MEHTVSDCTKTESSMSGKHTNFIICFCDDKTHFIICFCDDKTHFIICFCDDKTHFIICFCDDKITVKSTCGILVNIGHKAGRYWFHILLLWLNQPF